MKNDTQAAQVNQILRRLATLPGSQAVDVIAKKLPRLGPAEQDSPYHVSRRSFDVQQVPESFSIPSDSEEVIIRLHGSLGEGQAREALVDEFHAMFVGTELYQHWDVRAQFKLNGNPRAAYELTVFSHMSVTMPEPLA
jgi:hypothetical protein